MTDNLILNQQRCVLYSVFCTGHTIYMKLHIRLNSIENDLDSYSYIISYDNAILIHTDIYLYDILPNYSMKELMLSKHIAMYHYVIHIKTWQQHKIQSNKNCSH